MSQQQQQPQILYNVLGLFYLPKKPKSLSWSEYFVDVSRFYSNIASEQYNEARTFLITYPAIAFLYAAFVSTGFFLFVVRERGKHDRLRWNLSQVLKRDRARFILNILQQPAGATPGIKMNNVFMVTPSVQREAVKRGVSKDKVPTIIIKRTPAQVQAEMLDMLLQQYQQQQQMQSTVATASAGLQGRDASFSSLSGLGSTSQQSAAQTQVPTQDAEDAQRAAAQKLELGFQTPEQYRITKDKIYGQNYSQQQQEEKKEQA